MAIPTPSIDEIKSSIDATLANLQSSLRELNREIWSNPETAYQEHKAHETICAFLEAQGCTVTRHAYGLDTSFEATCGSGGPLINFNAEYDALPGIGHACGHNLITTSSVAAFLALSALLKKYGIPGRAQLLGTPAEENGGGKRKLIEKGAYNGVDISLMAHAGPKKLFPGVDSDGIAGVLMNARKEIHCEFTGKSAHAGGNPWDGINALDALVSAYNNVSVLRQQMQPDERVHVAFTETPTVANVIPERTKAFWQVRSPTLKGLDRLMARVSNCIEAGALSSGCRVDIVDYLVPTLHAMFAVADQEGLFLHHSSFATAAGTDTAHEEAVIVGKSLAMIGWDMLTDEGLFQTAKKQWEMAIVE
ncbi:hypothetical protein KXX19_000564 [Aspergillus fumigatus]|nr:hypothetical protein KXX61_000046 [Aspergillus fumigatus]KAH1807955.1 hypothetical protein KXX19_000564 [Aspergillus fumigatus]KAH2825872.1 hypothetical protein KXW76_002158 [Aspergillus fumigatus]